ncbi:MAG: hypothetical protein HC822_19500 [Oscillochloris sp.]|nr:hypothetical protein [Oscillochloris sp.]
MHVLGSRLLWIALLLITGLTAWIGWWILDVNAPRRELSAARGRWDAAPVTHYRIVVQMRGWGGCRQDAEVRYEQLVAVAENTCRFFNPRTVSALFGETERFLSPPEFGSSCRRSLPGRDCSCYVPYQVRAVYDPELGIPREVRVEWGQYAPNRSHVDYWRYLLANWREPACGGPLAPPGRHLVVEVFEILP